ncbi:hypothetical protein CR152_03810 [Massilia violaceinigra]|uniref:Uncharacterized protein n=1 Tax=Massilia violaceinigra TaxID=2045208 RepID=A0A2D2DFI2_9BURK|nr:hypothetical protein [Massilia violaceinigra]ATQ73733.1 hypothetical protein CR152_03810 [Massilia violaceinigra]
MTVFRFRLLLSLYIVFVLGEFVAAWFFADLVPPALAAVADSDPESWFISNLPLAFTIFVPLSTAYLAGLVGMFMLKAWGRSFSLYVTLAGLALTPFMGATVSSWLDNVLLEVCAMLWGAVLALAYYSPVSREFSRPPEAR